VRRATWSTGWSSTNVYAARGGGGAWSGTNLGFRARAARSRRLERDLSCGTRARVSSTPGPSHRPRGRDTWTGDQTRPGGGGGGLWGGRVEGARSPVDLDGITPRGELNPRRQSRRRWGTPPRTHCPSVTPARPPRIIDHQATCGSNRREKHRVNKRKQRWHTASRQGAPVDAVSFRTTHDSSVLKTWT